MAATTITVLGLFTTTVGTLLTVASIAYQIYQARKMKKAARDAAEARKGFEIVVEGDVYPVPIVYGRAKVGGIRVFSQTANNFVWPTTGSNADISFTQGSEAIPQEPITYDDGTVQVQPDIPSNVLDRSISGKKNEFLFYEQALCQGPINRVIDIVFEESRFLDDPDFVKGKSGLRVDVHYDGGTADEVISTNFIQRKTAFFTGLAHAGAVIRLNRDDPQFGGRIPMLQFFIEGRKVRTINNGTLSSTRTYTNNPAYCLLDYLLDDNNAYSPGKQLTINDIDLASFEAAANVCNTIVATNKPVGGKIWSNTTGTVDVNTTNIPLYECNIVIDSTKPIRENVEAILATMGDARLVWSQGKYKLLVQYPTSNEAINVATEITDDDIVQDSNIEVNWPDSSQRYNHCIVRFHNEGENFKEDTAVWPPKTSGTSTRGFNGKYYPEREPKWNESSPWNLLNTYGVWDESSSDGDQNVNTTTMEWKFIPLETGSYTFEFAVDDYGSLTVTQSGSTVLSRVIPNGTGNASFFNTITMTEGLVYVIVVQGVNTRKDKAAAFKVTGPDGLTAFSSRSIAYEQYIVTTQSSAIYDQLLAEDNGIELENDIFFEGCTDYYHALAKAEELVRTSRTALGIKFKYIIRDKFIEPGDIIRLNSATLNLGETTPLYIRVNESKIEDGLVCEITGTRFDYTQLAWNVADDQYSVPLNVYNTFVIPAPSDFVYEPNSPGLIYGSSGRLNWTPVASDIVVGYILYIHTQGDVDSNGNILFREIGRVTEPPFYLPAIDTTSAVFGIRSFSATGRRSELVTTGSTAFIINNLFTRTVEINPSATTFVRLSNGVDWDIESITLNAVTSNYTTPQYKWYVNDQLIAGETNSSLTVFPFSDASSKRYKVEAGETDNFDSTKSEDTVVLFSLQNGQIGPGGPTVDISGAGAFSVNAGGAFTPAEMSLTAVTTNITLPVYTWTVTNATASANNSESISIVPLNTEVYSIEVTLSVTGSNISSPIEKTVTIAVVYEGQPGQAGQNGLMSAYPSAYQWTSSETPPASRPSNSIYTWSNADYALNNGWSNIPPTNTTPGAILWSITIPLVEGADVLTSTLDWQNTLYPIRAIAYNGNDGPPGETGEAGANGNPGSATFLIDRGSSSNSGVPSNSEVISAISRLPITGDIATIRYNSGNSSIQYRRIAGSWTQQVAYITGSLIVENTITASKISVTNLSSITSDLGSVTAGSIAVGSGGTISGPPPTPGGYPVPPNPFPTGGRLLINSNGYTYVDTIACYGHGFFESVSGFGSLGSQAVYAGNSSSNSNGHGLRGQNTYYGSSGLVGVASFAYDFYAEGTGTYGSFTGCHDALLIKTIVLEPGDIVVDKTRLFSKGVSDVVFDVELSSCPNQPSLGVFTKKDSIKEGTYIAAALLGFNEEKQPIVSPEFTAMATTHDLCAVNALGEGQINVCGENGNIEIGDLIVTSSIPGKGMKQDDDIVRSYTVAKARENVTFDSPTEVKMIACIYLCG